MDREVRGQMRVPNMDGGSASLPGGATLTANEVAADVLARRPAADKATGG